MPVIFRRIRAAAPKPQPPIPTYHKGTRVTVCVEGWGAVESVKNGDIGTVLMTHPDCGIMPKRPERDLYVVELDHVRKPGARIIYLNYSQLRAV